MVSFFFPCIKALTAVAVGAFSLGDAHINYRCFFIDNPLNKTPRAAVAARGKKTGKNRTRFGGYQISVSLRM